MSYWSVLMDPNAPELPDLSDIIGRPLWMERAACAGQGTEKFITGQGQDVDPAKAVCAICPVREECLAYALEYPDLHGVWGGTSGIERERIRRAQRAA